MRHALGGGTMDYLEVVGKVAEMEFFRKLLGEGVLQRLAASYPTPRRKEEVPLWLYLASEITLRLPGAMGFGAYPYIVHCGGLLDALGPEQVVQKEVKPGVSRPVCRGYNRKNHHARTTPCDADSLRKLGKDTQAEALEHWFGTAVPREYQTLGGYDPEGIFLVDGTYLFVPLENDRYERSSRLLFGEDGHPLSRGRHSPGSEAARNAPEQAQASRCSAPRTSSGVDRALLDRTEPALEELSGSGSGTPRPQPL